MKCTVFIATSVDGFIARLNGGLDWLPQEDVETEDHGYAELMASVDTLLMGRNTYDMVRSFGDWPYGEKPVAVLTSRPLDPPPGAPVTAVSGRPGDVLEQMANQGASHIYVDGGAVIQEFLRAGLINELIVTKVPILIGTGIALFGMLENDIKLELLSVKSFSSGLSQSHYRVL